MLLTSSNGKVVAVTNPENEEQYIVVPGTHVLRIKEDLVRKYYLRSLLYTNEFGYSKELMMQTVIDEGIVENGDFVYRLIGKAWNI